MADNELDEELLEEDEEVPEDLDDLEEMEDEEDDDDDVDVDVDDDEDDDDDVNVDVDDETETAAPAKPAHEDEEEDEDEDDDDEVEASLDVILKERLVVTDDEEEDDDDDGADPDERGDSPLKVLPKQPGEFVCQSCFLVKHPSQLADRDRMLCRDCV